MNIKVDNISKTYPGGVHALSNVSFAINKPEVVGFLGPNGAGKTTLMKILTTLLQPSSGQVSLSGLDVVANSKEVQKRLGYLSEDNPLYTDMFVKEFLTFNAAIYKTNRNRIDEVIKLTGLNDWQYRKIENLSKGYKQRVGLAAALLHEPEILILDEPTTGLDPNQLLEVRQLIKRIGQTKTVFLSTHIMQEVEAMCDRVIIINKGEIVADAYLKDLRQSQQQIVVVEFDYRVENAFLKGLSNVVEVVNTHDFIYEITFNSHKDMRPEVFDFAHDNKLKILQLNQKNTTLEQLFKDLTR